MADDSLNHHKKKTASLFHKQTCTKKGGEKNTFFKKASKPQQRSQSTFIAVGGFNCVEELTERWMQLCPRFQPTVTRNSVTICWWWHYLFLRLSPPLASHQHANTGGVNWQAAQIASRSHWLGWVSPSRATAAEENGKKDARDIWTKWPFEEKYMHNVWLGLHLVSEKCFSYCKYYLGETRVCWRRTNAFQLDKLTFWSYVHLSLQRIYSLIVINVIICLHVEVSLVDTWTSFKW